MNNMTLNPAKQASCEKVSELSATGVIKEHITIGIAELVVMHNPAVLITRGLGSCVAISLRDPVARFGALAHIILPSIEKSNDKEHPLKFADSAIEIALKQLLEKGCLKSRIIAKIAGGACMFNLEKQIINVGARNIEAVINKLEELKIPILANDTGGNYGRTVEFDVETGVVTIKTALQGVMVI